MLFRLQFGNSDRFKNEEFHHILHQKYISKNTGDDMQPKSM